MNNQNYIAKKRFGQNFLINEFVINKIIELIAPTKNQTIVEIGPGLGALTKYLVNYVNQLHVVELDRDIIKLLKNTFDNKITIHEGDALEFDFSFQDNHLIRVIGNLPYNISTPLLFHLAGFSNILDMHFMLQKEVVDRICAKPNNKDYGRLSIMMQYKFNCNKLLEVNKESFTPIPKVESAIIRIIPKTSSQWINVDLHKLNIVVTNAFNQRRKTIQNSLKNIVDDSVFEKLAIDLKKRAENLTVDEYIQLSTYI